MNLKALNGAVNVKPDWVARLTRETSGGGKGRSVGTGLELTPAEEWLLNQDMKQYSDGVVPKDINNATRLSLDQPVLVQIINITNASQPSSNQPNSNNALLYLTLTDGVTKFKAVCTEDVQDITVRTPPGTKLLLRKCQIWKGCALLNRKSCTAVGGQVPTLIASWKESLARVREKEIAAAAGIKYTGAKRKSADGPPPFEAFSSAKAIEASSVRIAGGWDDVSTEVDSLIGILKDVSLEDQHFVFKIQDLKSKQKRVNASSGLSKALAARLDCDEQDIDVEKVKTRFALRRLEFKLQMDQDSPHVTDIVEMASHTSSQKDRKPKNDRKKSDNKSNNRKDPAPKKNNSREPRAGKSGDKGKDNGQNKRNNRGKGKSMQQEQSSSSRTKASSDSKTPPPPPPPVSGSGLSVNAPEFVPSSTSSREPSQGKNDTGRGKNETGRGKGNRGGGGGGRGGRGGRGRGRGRGSGAVQTKPPASKSSNRSRGGRGKQDT